MRAVEGEHPRLDGRQRDATAHAGEALAHPDRLLRIVDLLDVDQQYAVTELEGQLHRVVHPALGAVLDHDTVHHDVQVVALGPVEHDVVTQVHHLAIDPDPHEALAAQSLELDLELAAAATTNRGENGGPGAVTQVEDPIDDLLGGLGLDPLAASWTVGGAHPGVEQPEVVTDLGDRAHGGAGVLGQGALLDGDGRAQPLDGLHRGLGELLQELAGVGREGLDVAPLPLGVDGVKGQRRLARAARTGDHNQAIPGYRQVEILQVVLTSTPDGQPSHGSIGRCTTLAGRRRPSGGSGLVGPAPPTFGPNRLTSSSWVGR